MCLKLYIHKRYKIYNKYINMKDIKTRYCRVQWNDLIRISIDDKDIHFELGYCLKSTSRIIFKWKYVLDLLSLKLTCINILDKDKDKYINEEDIKYNIWHTLRCEKLEENFPKFVNDLQKNFRKEDWIQIIIEIFPSISRYSESEYDWIENKRKENWED